MSFTYSLIANSTSVLRSDGATIPNDPGNTDWRVYQAWLAAGGVPNAAPVAAAAPITVQMWQAEVILKQTAFTPTQAQASAQAAVASCTNLWDATSALIASQNNQSLTAFWNRSTTLVSNDATLSSLATALGVTQTQINIMFAAAQQITI